LRTRLEMARKGLGVIGIPDFVVSKALADGLSEVLPEYAIEPRVPIYAVYPSARFLSPKVSEFLDCLLKVSRENKIRQLT
jgi:DNA-binding transcriptional LysR family regulator